MKSVRIPAKVAREIKAVLEDRALDAPYDGARLRALVAHLEPPKTKKFVIAAKKRLKSRKSERQDEWTQIREKVLERANGVCECGCGGVFGDSNGPEVDHFLGGSDRRTLQSVYTCWALTATHHREKTLNRPNRAFWLGAFIEHCNHLAYGVPEDAEICTGYLHAASIAKAKLDSLRIQGRAE